MHLQETNFKILELLERFKYLSNSQLIKLGVASSQPSVARILQRFFKDKNKEIIKSPLVTKITFAVDPKKGKLQNLYCLNRKAAIFLAEHRSIALSEINYIKGSGFLNKDYFHRVTLINFHIDLYLESQKNNDMTIIFFHNYFDKIGSNNSNQNQMLEAKTKIVYNNGSFYIPDAIYKITKTISDGSLQEFYYILEIHKGNDTKRAIDTIMKNIKTLVDGNIAKKYDYEYSHKVVMVFDNDKVKDLVLKRLEKMEEFQGFSDFFEIKI